MKDNTEAKTQGTKQKDPFATSPCWASEAAKYMEHLGLPPTDGYYMLYVPEECVPEEAEESSIDGCYMLRVPKT